MPVTSTSVIAKFKNKPSIFYDPYNWIDRKDISLANNLVLDIEEVEKWLDTIKI
jgi:polysaccharide biosynthesis PFTS motif protein